MKLSIQDVLYILKYQYGESQNTGSPSPIPGKKDASVQYSPPERLFTKPSTSELTCKKTPLVKNKTQNSKRKLTFKSVIDFPEVVTPKKKTQNETSSCSINHSRI